MGPCFVPFSSPFLSQMGSLMGDSEFRGGLSPWLSSDVSPGGLSTSEFYSCRDPSSTPSGLDGLLLSPTSPRVPFPPPSDVRPSVGSKSVVDLTSLSSVFR